ncbi:type II toxin-antitoxin system MqsR family toxin [Faecalispora jeddahensis]|uniref:type II toxin-antitoxin system MqsR family toxin n=1 Tax=Faecalispora jeddahensis TaxID=1414721 RepID=UPI000694C14A|nr:type II toxin-antitoxin system MqsR family toxin [Faecalispora jeddahensis]
MQRDCTQINSILQQARFAIAEGNTDFVPRPKNMKTLSKLGMMPSEIYEEINDLVDRDWFRGPTPDRDSRCPDSVWEFKKFVSGKKLYIKFKIVKNENNLLRVLGFHFDGMK